MNRVEALQRKIRLLSEPEVAEFREWFIRYDAEAWNRQAEAQWKIATSDEWAAHEDEESDPF